jgi:hypothetical protein
MIKRLIYIVLSFACYNFSPSYAQTPGQKALNIPGMSKVLPPAPNAFELTKYAGLPVNMSSGSVNTSIPLGEIKQGKVSVPVSLSYNSGNGIKVSQLASRAGMGWVLNAGGVITRSVSGLPDETSTWMPTPPDMMANNTATYEFLYKTGQNAIYDGQPDIFSFNFNGYSGRFILNQAEKTKVIFLTATPLKVTTNFNNEYNDLSWSMRITDPNGIEYYFGGTNATEKSKSIPLGSGCGRNFDLYAASAWYLKKIKVHGVEEITFNYTACTFEYLSDISETLIRTPAGTLLDSYNPSGINTPCPQQSESKICASNLRSEGVILQSISSKLYNIKFRYVSRTDILGDSLLSAVDFYKKSLDPVPQPTLYDSYNLTYTHSVNSGTLDVNIPIATLLSRPFLTKVSRTISTPVQDHVLSYININAMPIRLSYNQDYWGYYNGAFNQHLVPPSNDANNELIFPSDLANRDPKGDFAKFGLLNKISYPSGGADSLVYEPNTVYATRREILPRATYTTTIQGTGIKELEQTTYAFRTVGMVSFDLTCNIDETGANTAHQWSIFQLFHNGYIEREQLVNPGSTYSMNLPLEGDYTLVISSYGKRAIGIAAIKYRSEGPAVTKNYEAGGVRLVKNITMPMIGNNLQKTFIYASLSSQSQSSGFLRMVPNNTQYYADLPIYMSDVYKQCLYKTGYSTPNLPLEFPAGGHIFYTDVIELKDNIWENGGVAHHYMGSPGGDPYSLKGNVIPGAPVSAIGFEPGMETATKTFATTGFAGGNYTTKTLQEVSTHYQQDSRLHKYMDIFMVRKKFDIPGGPTPLYEHMFNAFDVAVYSLARKWVYADTVTTTSYDIDGTNPLVSKQVFIYADTNHLQVSEVKTIMSDEKVNSIKLDYPHQMVQNGITTPYTEMIAANIITTPVIQQQYINNVFLQSVTTNFNNWGNGVFEPQTIQRKQGADDALTYVRIHSFDSDGNLLSQSQENGMRISYKYGYRNSRLVAEAKNATPTEFFSENFEEHSSAVTGIAHTGSKYYNGPYTVSWAIPNARQYKVTYWYLDGAKWKYAEQSYAGSLVLNSGSAIDDVNVYPVDGQLSTYTYDLATGTQSQTDTKGLTMYYEYDTSLRLKNIKDDKGYIVKNYEYNLNGTQINTGTGHGNTNPGGGGGTPVPLTYYNFCSINPSTSLPTGGVALLKIKNSAGTVMYTFTEAQLLAGANVAPGTYTFEYETYGPKYVVRGPNVGWGYITMIEDGFTAYYGIGHDNRPNNIYPIVGVVVGTKGFEIIIDLFENL